MLKVARIFAMALILWASAVSAWAADGSSKAVFAYGAINAYMTTTWVAREQGFFRKHSVDVEPVFIIASRAAQAMLAGEVHVMGPPGRVEGRALEGLEARDVRQRRAVELSHRADHRVRRQRLLAAVGAAHAHAPTQVGV